MCTFVAIWFPERKVRTFDKDINTDVLGIATAKVVGHMIRYPDQIMRIHRETAEREWFFNGEHFTD